jgi:hypothetical protein
MTAGLMSVPSKHHYIPVFYLKQWRGTDGRLCEYKRIAGRTVARRTFPDGTGYLKDLYKVEGLPDPIAQAVEQKFMHLVDTEANYALQKLLRGDATPWDSRARSAWTRFILSLRFRNPEAVFIIKTQMVALWQAILENMRRNYDTVRYEGDPPTFEEFVARTSAEAPLKAAMQLLQEIIDNARVGPTIFEMQWSPVSLPLRVFPCSLLTGCSTCRTVLGERDAYIALPIGPRVLFVADHDGASPRGLAALDPTSTVRNVNMAVVHQARQFVWGLDESQLRFVQNRMGRAPDRPVISDAQRQAAVDAALVVPPSNNFE